MAGILADLNINFNETNGLMPWTEGSVCVSELTPKQYT